jgi:CDP-diacylglycerol--serine O-phosphatidyltransferase
MIKTLRRWLPAAVTLCGLASGLSASLLALQDRIVAACVCVLAGNILDGLDGYLARRLGVASALGLQLDSLADMVIFGVAPSLLAYSYMTDLGLSPCVVWPMCVGFTLCGAFRLARFNLLPAKTSPDESLGLTISVAGATATMSVLVDVTYSHRLLPVWLLPCLLILLCVLMVSRIRYPELATLFRARWLASGWLAILVALGVWHSPQAAGLALVYPYVGFGLLRSAYQRVR